jgi:dTDP-glucose 4,6-dehydratase
VRNIFEVPGDVSYVIHAAATPIIESTFQIARSHETITKGTSAVIDASVRLTSLRKILNISSGQIYGRQGDVEAISEHYSGSIDCNTITSVYPEAKRYAETVCCAYWSLFKIPIVTARPFSFIGPYQRRINPGDQ